MRSIPRRWRKNGWWPTRLLVLAGLCLVAVAACYPAWWKVLDAGLHREASFYVLLAPVVLAWLIAVRVPRLVTARPGVGWGGLPVLAVGYAVFLFGRHADSEITQVGGALMTLAGIAVLAIGHDVMRRFLPVFGALVFFVPMPGVIWRLAGHPLQVAAAQLACGVYQLCGVNARVYDEVLRLGPATDYHTVPLWQTAQVLSMMTVLALVCYLFVFVSPLRPMVRLAVLLTCPVAAVLSAAGAMVLTLWLHPYRTWDSVHFWLQIGQWAMLLAAFMSLVGLIRLLAWATVPVRRFTLAHGS